MYRLMISIERYITKKLMKYSILINEKKGHIDLKRIMLVQAGDL